jgi:hypothetical protein
VTSEKQKLLDKLERKDKRRGGRGRPGADADIDWLGAHGLDALVEAELLRDTQGQARCGPMAQLALQHAACWPWASVRAPLCRLLPLPSGLRHAGPVMLLARAQLCFLRASALPAPPGRIAPVQRGAAVAIRRASCARTRAGRRAGGGRPRVQGGR